MTEVLAGFGGIVLGFLLSEIAIRARQAGKERMQRRSVRTVLRAEIDENLRLLYLFWNGVENVPAEISDLDPEALMDARVMARRVIQVPLPSWSHSAWESQLSSVASALTERQIRLVQVHHSRLKRISAIRDVLRAHAAERAEDQRSAQGETARMLRGLSMFMLTEFDQAARELWPLCDQIVRQVFNTGNPLGVEAQKADND